MKTIRSFISVIITIALFFAIIPINHIHADGNITITENDHAKLVDEEKIYSNATLEDNFVDDRVVVILKHDVSMEFKNYDTSDFSSINAKSVTDITYAIGQMAKAKVLGTDIVMSNGNVAQADNDIEVDKYNQMLVIELNEAGKDKVLEAVEILETNEDIMYVGPDMYLEMDPGSSPDITLPNNVASTQTTSTDLTNYPNEYDNFHMSWYARDLIKLPQAWYHETGSGMEAFAIGIIDTGIQGDHPDLADNICSTYYINKSFISDTDDPLVDELDHGTRVASIIGAIGNNATSSEQGTVGVCWDAELVSLKAVEYNADTGKLTAPASRIAEAVNHAEICNIKVLYLGIAIENTYYENYSSLRNAIERYNGVFVCTSGDDSKNIDTDPTYPAYFDLPNMIIVAACDVGDSRCDDANYGSSTVDLYAPGFPVYVCTADGGYTGEDGSEYAAAFVAGAAMLLRVANGGLTPYEIKLALMQSVDQSDEYEGYCVTGGRLNVYKAILRAFIDVPIVDVDDHVCNINYIVNSYTTHRVYCDSCLFEYVDEHYGELVNGRKVCIDCSYVMHVCTYTCTSIGNAAHKYTCTSCGDWYTETHTLVEIAGGLGCTKCNYTSLGIINGAYNEEDE